MNDNTSPIPTTRGEGAGAPAAARPPARRGRLAVRRILSLLMLAVLLILALLAFFALIIFIPLPEAVRIPIVVLAVLLLGWLSLLAFRKLGRWKPLGTSIAAGVMVVVTLLVPLSVVMIPGEAPRELKPRPEHTLIETDSFGNEIALYSMPAAKPVVDTPLVFVNGGPGGAVSNNTLAFLRGFADRGISTFAYDQLGTGASTQANDAMRDYTMDGEVERLRKVVEATGSERVVFMANSYGGNIVARYLVKYPDTVAKYIPVDTAPLYSMKGNTKAEVEKYAAEEEASSSEASNQLPTFGNGVRENTRNYLALASVLLTGRLPYGTPEEFDSAFTKSFIAATENSQEPGGAEPGDPELPSVDEPSTNLALAPSVLLNGALDRSPDTTGQLPAATADIPVLMFHPEFGIIPWPIAYESADFFPKFSVVAVPGAHHGVWDTQRGRDTLYRDTVAFMTDQPIEDLWVKSSDPFPGSASDEG